MDCAGCWPVTTPHMPAGFSKCFPGLQAGAEWERLMDDATFGLIVTAGVPSELVALSVAAMRRGTDVLADKPGITTPEDQTLVEKVGSGDRAAVHRRIRRLHLFLVTNTRTEHSACEGGPVPTFREFARDLRERSTSAMTQSHSFAVCRLAPAVEAKAMGGDPRP